MFAAQIYAIAPRARPEIVDVLVRRSSDYFNRYRIDRPLRLSHFVPQVAHESEGFTRLEENLNYSAPRLLTVFPKRVTVEQASELARRPRAIANHLYGGRLGNTGPDDGWRYRGRGLIHLTGKRNYQIYGEIIGIDLVADPDRAAEPAIALHTACAYWQREGCNEAADRDDLGAITRIINGGINGLGDRLRLTDRAKPVLFPLAARRVLKSGMVGHDIALLEGELVELGYGGLPDDTFTAATAARLRHFQRDRGLVDDGIAGPATYDALRRALAEARRDAA